MSGRSGLSEALCRPLLVFAGVKNRSKMDKIEFSKASRHRAFLFLRNISNAMRRRSEAELAKKQVDEQIKLIKKELASGNPGKKKAATMINRLGRYVNSAIDKGSRVTKYRISIDPGLKPLYSRLEKFEAYLDRFMSSYEEREKRIKRLEREIGKAPKETSPGMAKIRELEQRLREMEKLNSFDKGQINRVRARIEGLKKAMRKKMEAC